MNKTKIPWADYTVNPVKGKCPVACSYCYARKMYKRFNWNPEIRFTGIKLSEFPEKPSKIFVGSTMELFGDWVKPEWMKVILGMPLLFPQHTFIFLTKQPQNLPKVFPDNCWVGASVTDQASYEKALRGMSLIVAPVRFLSLEPLIAPVQFLRRDLDIFHWLIIGSQTQPTRHPKREWCREIIEAGEKAGIPIFIKEPLATYLNDHRQQFPI